jgi:hypothetical protein
MYSQLRSIVLPAPARWAAYAAAACALLAMGEIDGQRRAGQAHLDYVSAQAERTVEIAKKQTKVVIQTEIKYRDRIQKIYLKGEAIEKEVPIYVTAADDALYGVNAGFVRSYNAAWSGDAAGPPAESDHEPAGIPLSEVGETEAHNATACRAWREKAVGLAEFYERQRLIMEGATADGPRLRGARAGASVVDIQAPAQ